MAVSNNILLLPPMELKGDLASNWQFFKVQWEDYITTTESAGKNESIKALLLKTAMGWDCLNVLKSINLSPIESHNSKACLQALENYFKSAKYEVYERFKFYTCNQGPNELVDQCLTRLRHLSQSCNFGVILDSMLRDHLILGTKDKKAEAHLLKEKNVDLHITINCWWTSELAEQQLMKINSTTCENVDFSKKKIKVIKKINKLLVTVHVSFVIKNMSLVKILSS